MLRFSTVIILFVLLLGGGEVFAQEQKFDGRIVITVEDQAGGLIEGAHVKLRLAGGEEREAVTDENGKAAYEGLVDGEYEIEISKEGFATKKLRSVMVKGGKKVLLKAVLEIAPFESKVTIDEDEASIDNFGRTRILSQAELDALPDDPEELKRALLAMAGPTATGEEPTISVNGFAGGAIPPKSAIKMVVINQNVFSAQYEGVGGGGIEIYTSSRLEEFNGGGFVSGTQAKLNAADPFTGERNPSWLDYGGYLQGPLSKKSSFFINGGGLSYDRRENINAFVLNDLLEPVELRDSLLSEYKEIWSTLRFNYDFSDNHMLYTSLQYQGAREKGVGIGGLRLSSLAENRDERDLTFQMSETSILSKSAVNTTKLQFINAYRKRKSESDELGIEAADAFAGGGGQINSTNSTSRLEISNDTTWQKGSRYAVYFGGQVRGVFIDEDSLSNAGGRYIFNGGVVPRLDANNEPIADVAGNAITEAASSLERYRRTRLFLRKGLSGLQIRRLGGGASQFLIETGERRTKVKQFDVGLYFQNSISLRNDLSWSFGVRYEKQTNIGGWRNIAPRTGIVWAPSVNQKKKTALSSLPTISVGAGIFYQRVGEELTFNAKRSLKRKEFLVDDERVLDMFPEVPSIEELRGFSLSPTERRLDANIRSPYQILFNLTVNKRLPERMSLSLSVSYSRTNHALRSRNINAPLAGAYDANNLSRAVYPFGRERGYIFQDEASGVVKSNHLFLSYQMPKYYKVLPFLSFGNLNMWYTYRNTQDNLATGSGSAFNPYDFSNEFAVSDNNIRHELFVDAYLKLPFRIRLLNTFGIRSGLPFNITTGRDTNGDGLFLERPSFGSNEGSSSLTPYGRLNVSPSSSDQIIPRNFGRGPAFFGWDISIYKTFRFGGGNGDAYSLKFSVGIKNVLNKVNKSVPIGNMSSPSFNRSISLTRTGVIFAQTGQREVDFSLQFRF